MPLAGINEALAVLQSELPKQKEKIELGKSPEEKQILEKYATIGKQRTVLGFFTGSIALTGVWRLAGGKKPIMGVLGGAIGGVSGMAYGAASIRKGLFTELLSLPDDKSPFATRCRNLLKEKVPTNEFFVELQKQMRSDGLMAYDSWAEGSVDSNAYEPAPVMPQEKAPISTFDNQTTLGEPEPGASPVQSNPFFFNRPSEEEQPKKRKLAHDREEEYFFGAPVEREPEQPTTWEEIRRRNQGGQ